MIGGKNMYMCLCECVFPHVFHVSNFDDYLYFIYFFSNEVQFYMLPMGGAGNDVPEGLTETGTNNHRQESRREDMLSHNVQFTLNTFLKLL